VKTDIDYLHQGMLGSIYWKDLNGVYLGGNDFAAKAVGLESASDLIGKTDYDLFPKEIADNFRKNDLYVVEHDESITVEEEVIAPDGKKLVQISSKKPLLDRENNIVGVIGCTVDITYLKEVERDLRQSNKKLRTALEKAESANKAKSAFVANISHDIRTPLAGMISVAQAMVDDPSFRTTENIDDICKAAMNLLNMLNQILDFTKAESDDFRELQKAEVFPIRDIIDSILSLYKPSAKSKNLLLVAEVSNDVPSHIKTKPTFIHKILINLVGNALKFTEKGYVKINVWFNDNKSMLYFSVSDTGKGIPDDKKETVFDWFEKLTPSYKGAEHGTGLGLATVKNAVDALKGNIKITDNEDGGTVFTCNIPVKFIKDVGSEGENYHVEDLFDEQDLREVSDVSTKVETQKTNFQPDKSTNTPEIISGKHLLLIEDNLTAGKGASMMLKNSGFSVNWVETGKEGLSEILSGNYDVIISDVGLPDMNGDEVVLRAREEGVTLPIFALTGHANTDKEVLMESGFTGVMVKPLNIKLFLGLVRHHESHNVESRVEHDRKVIIDLSLSEGIGLDIESAKEILRSFIEGLDAVKQELKQAIAEKNIKSLREILHRTRGGATYACVPRLSAVMKVVHETLKEYAMAGEQIDFDKLFQPLFDSIEELEQEYQKHYL